jgi:hypothetical protein
MANPIQSIKNFLAPVKKQGKSLNNYITPVQFQRFRHDVMMWRRAVEEAEYAYFPYRVKMQRMYIDTVLNGHTEACWNRRKDLSLLRGFTLCDDKEKPYEDLINVFNQQWFTNFLSYCLDAQAFGYSLISLGDVINDSFPQLKIMKRWNISPDRETITKFEYGVSGVKFLEDAGIKDWHVWVPTTNEIGTSNCGYGLLYKVALYEIYLRNNLGFNADYAQNYGQPIRKGTTTKIDDQRKEFEEALMNMGNDAWILLDPSDNVELVESKGAGQGYKVYESIELRCEKKISKIILGHADVIDSVPGKLGAQNGADSPAQQALRDTQAKDARFLEPIVNDQLIPRMRKMGFNIPDGIRFQFKNDQEKEEYRDKEDKSNKATADIAYTMVQAGMAMDPKYFEDRTGIPTKAIPKPVVPKAQPPIEEKIQNRLNKLYSNV